MASCDAHSGGTSANQSLSQMASFDPTPPNEKAEKLIRSADPHDQDNDATGDISFETLLFIPAAAPATYTLNYSSFTTSYLTEIEVEDAWNCIPVVMNGHNATAGPEARFVDVVGKIYCPNFTGRIKRGTVIDIFGLNTSVIKYIATYSHIMDNNTAYIRLVAYNQYGLRCHAAHPNYGNRILAIPRSSNDVIFPASLRFHALHAIENSHFPDEAHDRIKEAAWSDMNQLERVWWEMGRCAICDTDI